MTESPHVRSVDSDMVDQGRRLWRAVAGALVIGLLLGGALGAAYGASRVASFDATTAVQTLPNSTIDTSNTNTGNQITQDATSYTQSELVVINGDQLAQQVRRTLGLASRPTISGTEVGQTYVVQITATATTSAEAVSIAQATARIYAAQRADQLTTAVRSEIAATQSQLNTVRDSLDALQNTKQPANPLTPSQTALQTEYERLLALRSSYTSELTQVGTLVKVQAPASAVTSSLSTTTKYAGGGALVGAVLAVLLLILARRTRPRVRSLSDLAALDVDVLLPVLLRRPVRTALGHRAWRSQTTRLLAARIYSEVAELNGPIVVVGATEGVGTSFVAASLASALAERGPVLLVLAGDEVGVPARDEQVSLAQPPAASARSAAANDAIQRVLPSSLPGVWLLPGAADLISTGGSTRSGRSSLLSDVLGRATRAGWLVVIDGPPLSETDVALDCVTEGGAAALVVGRGRSTPSDVVAAAELLESRGTVTAGAVLNDVPSAPWRLLMRSTSAPGATLIAREPDDEPAQHRPEDRPEATTPTPSDVPVGAADRGAPANGVEHDDTPTMVHGVLIDPAEPHDTNDTNDERTESLTDDLFGAPTTSSNGRRAVRRTRSSQSQSPNPSEHRADESSPDVPRR